MIKWLLYWIAFAAVFVGGTYYYDCRIKRVCGASALSEVPALPISFSLQSSQPIKSDGFPSFKQDLLRNSAPGDALQITGLYYSDEPGADLIDLGTLRAQATAREFVDDLVPERIRVSSKKLESPAPVRADQRFIGAEFSWVALIAPMPASAATAPLTFNAASSEPIVGVDFPAMQAALNNGMPGQRLSIVGQWFDGETQELGLARAAAIQKLFSGWIAPERCTLSAAYAGAPPAPAPFAAATFQWQGAVETAAVPAAAAAPVPAPLSVYFESNSARVIQNAQSQPELAAFVAAAAAAGQSISVVGHTDSSGAAGKNNPLGQRRAEALAQLLRDAGFAGGIRTNSQSDARPKADNATAEGKRLNRRAEASVE